MVVPVYLVSSYNIYIFLFFLFLPGLELETYVVSLFDKYTFFKDLHSRWDIFLLELYGPNLGSEQELDNVNC